MATSLSLNQEVVAFSTEKSDDGKRGLLCQFSLKDLDNALTVKFYYICLHVKLNNFYNFSR